MTHPNDTPLTLAAWREARSLTITELARRAGIERQIIYNIESGRKIPRRTTITKLVAALEIDPDLLVFLSVGCGERATRKVYVYVEGAPYQEIPLNDGYVALVDNEDFERVSRYTWSYSGKPNASVHTRTGGFRNQKIITMHRFVMDAPEGVQVDHKNRNRLDNRRSCNLRFATPSLNCGNKISRPGKSQYKGVSISKGEQYQRTRWRAQIGFDGKKLWLGHHDSAEEAARAYDTAARLLFGEFARLNFPEDGEQSALE